MRGYRHDEVVESPDVADQRHARLQAHEGGLGLDEFRRQVKLVIRARREAPGQRDDAAADSHCAFAPVQEIAVLKVAAELAGKLHVARLRLDFGGRGRRRRDEDRQQVDAQRETRNQRGGVGDPEDQQFCHDDAPPALA
jgi:hypothetical protein